MPVRLTRLLGAICLLAMAALFAHEAMAISHPAESAAVEEHAHDDCAPDGCSTSTAECCHGHCIPVFFMEVADCADPCPRLLSTVIVPADPAPEAPVREIEHPPQLLS